MHTVRICAGMRCSTKRAEVMMPSQPSFWIAGNPERNLSVTSLPRPALRKAEPGIVSIQGSATAVFPSRLKRLMRKRTSSCSWIFPRLWSRRSTSCQCASGVTMRHDSRLSSVVPHSTAFLPPAFIAILPPMQDASCEVGSTANTRPCFAASSDTRRVTVPAPQCSVGTVGPPPGSTP